MKSKLTQRQYLLLANLKKTVNMFPKDEYEGHECDKSSNDKFVKYVV